MTLLEIKNVIDTTGLPVTYYAWPKNEAPALPYICYRVRDRNTAADGKVYFQVKHIVIELYTKNKDEESEQKIEEALIDYVWTKDEDYIESERCFLITYELEV
ncbi:MAG: hypothetical protein EGR89_04285 [[Eubacterium] rectale]|nr:hypothetical protein [Agathobacter rectalis]